MRDSSAANFNADLSDAGNESAISRECDPGAQQPAACTPAMKVGIILMAAQTLAGVQPT
jgi:hypothetical protein